MTQQTPQKRGFGCLGYGCIIAVVLVVVTIGGLFLLARSAMRGAVERFTTEQPLAVPTVTLDENARASLTAKLDEVKRVMDDPRASGEFALSQAEVSGLLANTPFNGKVLIELTGDAVEARFSFPLLALGQWDAAKPIIGDYLNRYATGSAKAKVAVTDGVAAVTFDSLVLNGQVFDGDALKEANEWVSGFVNSQGDDPNQQRRRSRIQSAQVENSKALVRIQPE